MTTLDKLCKTLVILTLLPIAILVEAKPEHHEHIKKLLPHKHIKQLHGNVKGHIQHKVDKKRRFYNDDHGNDRHVKGHHGHSHGYSKHGYKHYHGRIGWHYHRGHHRKHYRNYHGDRYYNGWDRYHSHSNSHDRYYYGPRYQKRYWRDHRYHGYRHKRYKGHHYYYNNIGFYFPGYGLIKHGHRHGPHCPDWHGAPFVAGVTLAAILGY